MSSTMEECVLDFDIDLFQHLPKYDVEKAHKSVRLMKTKVTSTSSLIKKYNNKGVFCKTLENCLLASKESYKQVCIERMEFREKCAALEEEITRLREANRELNEKYIAANNQCDGIQSHSKQLALLVQENETTIESLKIENQLEKSTTKDIEKKCAGLQKENDHLIKNIRRLRDIVLGKKTATKEIKSFLNKYGKAKNVPQEVNSSDETDGLDECLSPLLDPAECKQVTTIPAENNNTIKLQRSNTTEENNGDDNDHDSESSNEVVSTDTGRGSSLAFSDSDKSPLLSPEYYIDHSPLGTEVIRSKDKMVVSIATSPILTREFTCVATSPIMFKDQCLPEKPHIDDWDRPTMFCSQENRQPNRVSVMMIDREVSPIFTTQYVDMSTITDRNMNCDAGTSPIKPDNTPLDCNYDSDDDRGTQEQECLDINNSNNLVDESSNDGEIQMILDTMRFHQNLITPIPTTPAKPRTEVRANISTLHAGGVCPDVAKVREENIALQATVAKLAQEVMNINNFLNKCGESIKNGTAPSGESQTFIKDKDSIKHNDKINLQNLIEPKTPVLRKDDLGEISEGKKPLSFKGKISKLKELFDDSSPPQVPLCAASPAPLTPPPPSSPPLSPLSSVVGADLTICNNNDNIEPCNGLKSKMRLDFEDPLSNCGSIFDDAASDQEILYEHEIVVELTPDSQESDRHSLHEFLKEQQSKPEEAPVKRTRRARKLTKLEKLRNNMAPRSKIPKTKSQEGSPRRKLRVQPKRLTANKQRILDSGPVSPGTSAYEKARRVMAEMRSQGKDSSAPVVFDRISKTPEKNGRKSLDLLSSITENHMGTQKHNNGSIIRNDVDRPDELSAVLSRTTLTGKDCSVETGPEYGSDNRQKNQIKNSRKEKLSKRPQTKKISQGFKKLIKKPVRTGSQSKSIDELNDIETEGNFNTNHLTSPSLKIYGRNKPVKKEEISLINNNTLAQGFVLPDSDITEEERANTKILTPESRKRLKRPSVEIPDVVPKRILRSSSVQPTQTEEDNPCPPDTPTQALQTQPDVNKEIVNYDDLDLFEDSEVTSKEQAKPEQVTPMIERHTERPNTDSRKLGILCTFLDKYGIRNIKRAPKISENMTNAVCNQLEESIVEIQKLPPKETKQAMDKLVKDLQSHFPNHVLTGLIKYLKDPARKLESYNKINVPPAPPMTKVEQILIYVVAQLKVLWPNYKMVDNILNYIEYTLFVLNRTPEFEVIENLSHFYAILCRYDKNRNRLRLFVIDAMYCLQFKAVPLIRQCLDVWMHILPLAHLGIAKNPLVTCLVYLLHFYKCEDKFNRVQEIRNILRRKYFYEVTEWNETGILEMFRNSILELRENACEKKMLRMALIILAKRNGARWCQNHIVKNMLLPIAEQADVPDRVKHFCVALLGPLLKPYPMDMKVNCEVVMNQLFDMLKRNPTPQMEEAIYTSLIYMSRHNQHRVINALLCWTPDSVSPELEELLKNYVKERPRQSWKHVISKLYVQN